MAMLRIQKKRIKDDLQYILDSGELVGKTCYKRNYFIKYKAVTFHEGRERYVLQIHDLRGVLVFSIVFLGLFLPEEIRNILLVPIFAAVFFSPRLSTVWADGNLIARERKQRFLIGRDCYELRCHSEYKSSLMKNGAQTALYTMKTAYGLSNLPYEILHDGQTRLDIIILFCVYLDVTDDITRPRGTTSWKTWVPRDRYRERANWRPPATCEPPQAPSTTGLPGDSTD